MSRCIPKVRRSGLEKAAAFLFSTFLRLIFPRLLKKDAMIEQKVQKDRLQVDKMPIISGICDTIILKSAHSPRNHLVLVAQITIFAIITSNK